MRSILVLTLLALGACKNSADDSQDVHNDDGLVCDPVSGVGVLTGIYTGDLTLTADCNWLLRGGVFIGDDVEKSTLTIEPGTTLYGESATSGFLVINRSSQIFADGTADAPIVFTSDLPVGSRGRGTWGGLVLNGRAPINACADGTEACEAEGEGGTGVYGGDNPDDSSGVLRFVRVEYGGTEISPDNEINGISAQGVGRGTVIDHVQIHSNLDDGIEFFGGTVDAKHLVVSCPGDDGIDWDLGWQGRVQYAVVAQCDDAGNNGIEADNNETVHTASPMSKPVLSHVTLVGSPNIPEDNFGALLRRGTGGELHNVVMTHFSAACLAIRDQATYDNFPSKLGIDHSVIDCEVAFEDSEDETETMQEEDVFNGGTGNLMGDPKLGTPGYSESPDWRPATDSIAASGGVAPSDSFFEDASYRGAFEPGGADWTAGWTQYARQ